ncbi:MAG: hypothetical protein ACRDYC_00900 [Acidimicrobiales bacterium]
MAFTVVVAAAIVLVVVAGSGSSPKVPGVAASGYTTVNKAALGFSIQVPATWVQDVDPTPGSVFYAHSAPLVSWVRLFRGETPVPLAASVPSLIAGLQAQGAQNIVQMSTQLDGVPAVRLDYEQADGPVPGALLEHTSYQLVTSGSIHYGLTLETTQPAQQSAVLNAIAASFRLTSASG